MVGGKFREADRYYENICEERTYNFVLGYLVIFKVCSFSKCIMSTHYSLAAVLDKSDAYVLKAEMEKKLLSELEQRAFARDG